MATNAYRVRGTNEAAPFSLTVHRSEGMALLAMNWRRGRPPDDFVGFGIQYVVPGGTKFNDVPNRLSFEGAPALPDGAHPEVPLGPLPARRRPSGRLQIRRDAGLHGCVRPAVNGPGPGGGHRVEPGDVPGRAQRGLHPWVRLLAGVRRQLPALR